jgi:hypothetical protein
LILGVASLLPPGTNPSKYNAGSTADLTVELVADAVKPAVAVSGVAGVGDSLKGKATGPSREGKVEASLKRSNAPPKKDEEAPTGNIRSVPNRRSTVTRKSGPSRVRETDKRQRSSSLPPKRQNLPIIFGLDEPQQTDIVIV